MHPYFIAAVNSTLGILDQEKSDNLKPLYGAMFAAELSNYTHWGWMDTACIYGGMTTVLKSLLAFDVVTYPSAVRKN